MPALFGRRLRRGATTTAVAAAAIAALSASQAPGLTSTHHADGGRASSSSDSIPDSATGDSEYYSQLPPLNSPVPSTSPSAGGTTANPTGDASKGIPASVLDAYKKAEASVNASRPGCNLPWQLLAAIGEVESGQARGGQVDSEGTTLQPILGPLLDGNGFEAVRTDDGSYDRARGPMQFIASTWATWGVDGNGDGTADPDNVYDAALSAAHYLCGDGRDLSQQADRDAAILSYNHSNEYLDTVTSWYEYYLTGTHSVPDGTGVLPSGPGPLDPDEPLSAPVGGGTPSPQGSHPGTSHPSTPPSTGSTPPGGSTSPSTPPSTPPHSPPATSPGGTDTPPADPVVSRLVKTTTDLLTAVEDALFGTHASVRAETSAGKPLSGVSVTFTIVGDTDTRFDGGASAVTVTTGADGNATAPALQAGDTAGSFSVRASVGQAGVASVLYDATVTAPQADKLERTGSTDALTADTGTQFATPVTVKATLNGAAVSKVAVTATLLTEDGSDTAPAGGPSFKTADGSLVKTVSLVTGADGTLELPALVAGDSDGTYKLQITAAGGGTLTLDVKVTTPAAPTGSPSESPSPSAS